MSGFMLVLFLTVERKGDNVLAIWSVHVSGVPPSNCGMLILPLKMLKNIYVPLFSREVGGGGGGGGSWFFPFLKILCGILPPLPQRETLISCTPLYSDIDMIWGRPSLSCSHTIFPYGRIYRYLLSRSTCF